MQQNIFLILLNSVSKMPLGGGFKGPRADNMPRAPPNVNPALAVIRVLYDRGRLSNRATICSSSGMGALIAAS
jgi:hypothetical protein